MQTWSAPRPLPPSGPRSSRPRDQRGARPARRLLPRRAGPPPPSGTVPGSWHGSTGLDVALVYDFLGQIRLSQGDHDGAAQLFGESRSAPRSADDRFTILVALYDLALNSQAQGDLTIAGQRLREGLTLAAEAGDEPSAACYLEALAALARQQDDPPPSAHLLSSASALRQAKGSDWLHAYVRRTSPEEVRGALRSELGDAAFDQAWASGGSFGGGRAAQYALEEARPDHTPPLR